MVGAFLKQGYNVVATSRNVSQQLTASTTVVLIDGGIGKPETAAKVVEAAGWYAFRHTYRTLLDDLGTPVGVQQKLMRYSDIRTTMNVYGSAHEQRQRQANVRVAGKLLEQPAAKQLMQ